MKKQKLSNCSSARETIYQTGPAAAKRYCPLCGYIMSYDYGSYLPYGYRYGYYCLSSHCVYDERIIVNYAGYPQPVEGWQLCPACNGTGLDNVTPVQSGTNPCPVCDGKRIINIQTGKPPE